MRKALETAKNPLEDPDPEYRRMAVFLAFLEQERVWIADRPEITIGEIVEHIELVGWQPERKVCPIPDEPLKTLCKNLHRVRAQNTPGATKPTRGYLDKGKGRTLDTDWNLAHTIHRDRDVPGKIEAGTGKAGTFTDALDWMQDDCKPAVTGLYPSGREIFTCTRPAFSI